METLNALRHLCKSCPTAAPVDACGTQFEARQFDTFKSAQARYGILATSQLIGQRLVTVYDNAIDGASFEWSEILPGKVSSRATGGLGKYACGHDPQTFRRKIHKKTQSTELMYIHRELCMLNYIGSTMHDDNNTGPVYIRNNDNIITVAKNQDFATDLFMEDARAMARALDGSIVFGNWGGDNSGEVVPQAGNGIQGFPHFDGAMKQTLLQADATQYPSVTGSLPEITGSGAYFLKWYGTWKGAYTSLEDLVEGINLMTLDINDEQPYTAIVEDAAARTITITGSDPEVPVYGFEGVSIFYSEDGTVNSCDEALDMTVIMRHMDYAELPLLVEFQSINDLNFYDHFKEVIKEMRKKLVRLYEGDVPTSISSDFYILIDPLLIVDKEFSALERMCSCEDASGYNSALDRIFPRFIPVPVMEGTGLYLGSLPSNLIFLTNSLDGRLGNTEQWYDPKCQTIGSRLAMLGNLIIADFSLVVTNAQGSSFHRNLTAPYMPENLPHLAGNSGRDVACVTPRNGLRITAKYVALDDGSYELMLDDTSGLPGTREWELYVNGTSTAVASTDKSITIPVPEINDVNLVILRLTEDGQTLEATMPGSQINECC